jgi:hypothetical protein
MDGSDSLEFEDGLYQGVLIRQFEVVAIFRDA